MVTAVAPLNPVPVTVTVEPITPDAGVKPEMVGGAGIVKLVALVPVPAPVVTEIGPVEAPLGTTAENEVESPWLNAATTPLNRTVWSAWRFVPLTVTYVPAGPVVGVNPLIVGGPAAVTVNVLLLVTSPCGVRTVIGPVSASAGTCATTRVSLSTANVGSNAPMNATPFPHVKPVPVIVTAVPAAPLEGEKVVMVGAAFEMTTASAVSELLPRLSVAIAVMVCNCAAASAVASVGEKLAAPLEFVLTVAEPR